MHQDRRAVPLIVDLDGTLLRTDSLWEACLGALRAKPWEAVFWPAWMLAGKAVFKRRIAQRAQLDVTLLPYDANVLDYAREAAAAGREVALVTAADQSIADDVARHLGIFPLAQGSDGSTNLGGSKKAAWLTARYPQGYEYIGDRHVDKPVWDAAAHATAAGPKAALLHQQFLSGHDSAHVILRDRPKHRPVWRRWASAMRLHQWSKNVLLFVPFIMAGKLMGLHSFLYVLLGMLAISLLASATYLINDLLDLPADRQHPTKKLRAFATGALSIPQGIAGVAVLMLLSGSLLWLLSNADFALIALAYTVTTLIYSFFLKREVLVDVMVLSGLYTLRITAGSILLALPLSWWLISFSFLFFLSLAMMKRYAELDLMQRNGKFKTGRDYRLEDMPVLRGMGVAATFGAVVLFIIYLILEHFNSDMFSNPQWLWPIAVIILLWQARLWLITNRGEMDQDPIYYAIKDKGSIKFGGLCLLMIVLAW